MKKIILFLSFITTFSAFGQVQDDFSDGDFTKNPTWNGMTDNFIVNNNYELQSNASKTSKSYLTTRSEAFDDATWEVKVRIEYTTSSANYASIYIISDRADISGEFYGYYVQIGGTDDKISLYRKSGNSKTEIIAGTDKIIDTTPVEVIVKVTRAADGTFRLYRKLPTDADFIMEGQALDNKVLGSKYFGLFFSNSASKGDKYFFDDVRVSGNKLLDEIPPYWTGLELEEPNKLVLSFSEEIDFSEATFQVDNGIGTPLFTDISADKTSVKLTFKNSFQRGTIYNVSMANIKDTAGNLLEETEKKIGIIEDIEVDDIVINEILPNTDSDTPEYFEIYNTSDKVLDLSNLCFGTRKTDGSFKPSNYFPPKTLLLPKSYLAVTPNSDIIKTIFNVPDTANIVSSERWSALSNTSAGFLITNASGDVVYDEVTYHEDWHSVMIKNPKGVALERINPTLPSNDPSSWHSAASDVHYGTPGYRNSQYRNTNTNSDTKKWVWTDPEVFTPDNDGMNDVCFIHYNTDTNGYTANVLIFNSVGVLVKRLATNYLLGHEGVLVWDGKTNKNQNVNPGIYVLYFEMINIEKGVKKVEKMPLVVSAR